MIILPLINCCVVELYHATLAIHAIGHNKYS